MALVIEWNYSVAALDDRGDHHWTNFRVKAAAIRFAKALARNGFKAVEVCHVGPGSERVVFEHGDVGAFA